MAKPAFDPRFESIAQGCLVALTLAFEGDEQGAVDELRSHDRDLVVDFLFGALIGTIQGWSMSVDVDTAWLVQEMGRRSAKVFLGMDPDAEDEL